MLKIPVIIGPTGVGKTDLAIKLALNSPIGVEIVSLDSVMLYKELNIGAAKPSLNERCGIKHHLIDVTSITSSWSLGKVWEALKQLLPDILQRRHLPMLVGGTMLYYNALINGLTNLPATDSATKQKLTKELKTLGSANLYQKLVKIDPITAARIDPKNPSRIMRSLAVFEQTGLPLSKWLAHHLPQKLPFEWCTLVVNDTIAKIRERIARRFTLMLTKGLIEETRALYQQFAPERPQLLNSVGYRQIWDYLAGNYSYDEAINKAILATGQLAKRQQTWLKSFTYPQTIYTLSSDAPTKPFEWFKRQLDQFAASNLP